MMSAPVQAAAATTVRGAPDSQATGGSASVAAIEPSETYRVAHTVTTNNTAATPVASGVRTQNTPAATATPLPPWKRSQTGEICPTTAAAPVAATAAAPPAVRCAITTAATPFATSSTMTATARHAPVVRRTLAAPTFPLPTSLTSTPA